MGEEMNKILMICFISLFGSGCADYKDGISSFYKGCKGIVSTEMTIGTWGDEITFKCSDYPFEEIKFK